MEEIEITVVGAGVIGLAIALELASKQKNVLIIEKNLSFGQEISSRNSEVIHAGIYYPKGSLKQKTCIEGRKMLYEFCLKNNIAQKKLGKLIVAINQDEIKDLESLFKQGLENGVEDLVIISKNEIKKLEPYVEAKAAIYSPSTGILDSHAFMKNMLLEFKDKGGMVAYNTEIIGIDKTSEGFEVVIKDKEETFKFLTHIFINSAGLNSDKIANMVGMEKAEYKLKYSKGDYFRVHQNKAKFIHRLVYPIPKKEGSGLGIHATLDLSGGLRLGPDDEYVDRIDYTVDPAKGRLFYDSIRSFLSFILPEDITSDMSGIRPKLQGPQEGFRDFIIRDEKENGYSGFINLIGIESPGLTSSLSIARIVKDMVVGAFKS